MTRFIEVSGILIALDAIAAIFPPIGGKDAIIRLMKGGSVDVSEEDWHKVKELLADHTTVLSTERWDSPGRARRPPADKNGD